MILEEIGTGSLRRENYYPKKNFILQQRELDFLEEKRCNSQLRVTAYQRRMAWCFNSKVKTRRFQAGDLVLRKVLHNKGALDPGWEGLVKIAELLTPGGIQIVLFKWRVDPQIMEHWSYENVLPMIVCARIHKNLAYKNSELGEHIVWNVELKKNWDLPRISQQASPKSNLQRKPWHAADGYLPEGCVRNRRILILGLLPNKRKSCSRRAFAGRLCRQADVNPRVIARQKKVLACSRRVFARGLCRRTDVNPRVVARTNGRAQMRAHNTDWIVLGSQKNVGLRSCIERTTI